MMCKLHYDDDDDDDDSIVKTRGGGDLDLALASAPHDLNDSRG